MTFSFLEFYGLSVFFFHNDQSTFPPPLQLPFSCSCLLTNSSFGFVRIFLTEMINIFSHTYWPLICPWRIVFADLLIFFSQVFVAEFQLFFVYFNYEHLVRSRVAFSDIICKFPFMCRAFWFDSFSFYFIFTHQKWVNS